MTDRGLGDNNGPPLEEPAKFSKRKWALTLLEKPKKPVGAVAMAFKLYMEMDAQGCGAVIPDADFVVSCGVSDRSIRTFKRWLLDNGFVEIKVKGARGRQTEFIARIPGEEITATVAAIMEQMPATNSGKSAEYRQPLPETVPGLPEMPAGDPQLPANPAGDLADSRAGAHARSSNNIYNINNKLTSSESVAGGGALAGLNGSADPMLIDILGWMVGGDQQSARRWLSTNIDIYGQQAVRDAYAKLKTDLLEGATIGRPLQVWIKIAQGIRNGGGTLPTKPLSKTFAERMNQGRGKPS